MKFKQLLSKGPSNYKHSKTQILKKNFKKSSDCNYAIRRKLIVYLPIICIFIEKEFLLKGKFRVIEYL